MKKKLTLLTGIFVFTGLLLFIPTSTYAYHYYSNPVTVRVETDKNTYVEGDSIDIKVIAENNSYRSQTLYFNSGCQAYYKLYSYSSSAGDFDSRDGRFCTQSLTQVTIPGYSSKNWTFTHTLADKKVGVGNYLVIGGLEGYGSDSVYVKVDKKAGDGGNNKIVVKNPNGGERLYFGDREYLNWDYGNNNDIYKRFDIRLASFIPGCGENSCPTFKYEEPYKIAENYRGTSYRWRVGRIMDYYRWLPEGTYKMEVCLAGTDSCDVSDGYFTLLD